MLDLTKYYLKREFPQQSEHKELISKEVNLSAITVE